MKKEKMNLKVRNLGEFESQNGQMGVKESPSAEGFETGHDLRVMET